MYGINLNAPISYQNASLRYFYESEHHITRLCGCDVLLLVFNGILKFSEDGEEIEVKAGEYYIQKSGSFQKGNFPSDKPQYLYVHFKAEWINNVFCLPRRGIFNYGTLKPLIEKMHSVSLRKESYVAQKAVFYSLLSALFEGQSKRTIADEIAEYLIMHYNENITLEFLCSQFNFSKNYIIILFKEQYAVTPFEYLLSIRLENAKRLLQYSSHTAEQIAYACGFSDYSNFYKCFKRETSLSPNAWRKQFTDVLTATL